MINLTAGHLNLSVYIFIFTKQWLKGIKMYQTGEFLGECELHESIDKWCNPDVSFRQRWKALYRPTGMPPKETFHLEKRHCGIIAATFHYCTIHLRCLVPELWNKRNKRQMNIQ